MDYSIEAVTQVWGISLAIGILVIGVVGLLLHRILKTATEIEKGASEIWTQGKLTANNTIHIPTLLSTTNNVTEKILKNAIEILNSVQKVEDHIGGCPGCPDCILHTEHNQPMNQ